MSETLRRPLLTISTYVWRTLPKTARKTVEGQT